MATFTVTTTDDVVNAGDGVLSLREALAEADAEPTVADRIEFDLNAMGGSRIVLAGSQLTVDSDVTIDGGSGVTIDANQQSRVLLVAGGVKTDVNEIRLEAVTITGGHLGVLGAGYEIGGGINADYHSKLTIIDSHILDNYVGGYYVIGAGIHAPNIILKNSTVSGNKAYGAYTFGAAIYGSNFENGSVVLLNSTIAENIGGNPYGSPSRSSAVIDTSTSPAIIINSTIVNNVSGGIKASGLTVNNCIIAGNTEGGREPDVQGGITFSNGHNIFGSNVTGSVAGDLENVSTELLFAGGLVDNGGPTPTIALRNAADNPALAGADPADSPAIDQRDVARPQPGGTNPDIGAFELNQSTGGGPTLILGTNRGEVLLGTAGPDLMRGFGGNDTLRGFGGADQLFGGAGNDVLYGKGGLDRLQGNAGADRFALRLLSDAPTGGPAYDEILDFSRLQHDRIDLSQLDAVAGTSGNQAFRFIGDDPFSRAGQVRAEATADGDFLVSGNVDRDLDADFAFVVHTGVAKLVATDFLL
jgi:Ca2+-binding RTX toxin-like protein